MKDIKFVLNRIFEVRNRIVSAGWCRVTGFGATQIDDGMYSLRFVLGCKNIDGGDFVELGRYLDSVFEEWLIKIEDGKFVISGIISVGD